MVEHPLRDREIVASNPGHAILKALKMVPVATLLGAQHYKASSGFSSPNKILSAYVTLRTLNLSYSLFNTVGFYDNYSSTLQFRTKFTLKILQGLLLKSLNNRMAFF